MTSNGYAADVADGSDSDLALRPEWVRSPPNGGNAGSAAAGPLSAISEHTQLDCGPDPTSPALRASSASFVKIFFPAMRPDSQAPVI